MGAARPPRPPSLLPQFRSCDDDLAAAAARIASSYTLLESADADLPPGDAEAAADAVAGAARAARAAADAAARLEAARPALERDLAKEEASLRCDADALVTDWAGGAALAGAGAGEGRAVVARAADAVAGRGGRWADLAAGRAVFGGVPANHEGLDKLKVDLAGLGRLYG